MIPSAALVPLPSFQRGAWYHSRDRIALASGAELCLTPELDVVAELMQGADVADDWDLAVRADTLNRAAALFASAPLLIGERRETPQDFQAQLVRAHGIPANLTEHWAETLVGIVRELTLIQPVDKLASYFVSLPANTMLCLEAVYRALWAGRRVFLRPSQREPWSALRLVAALITAGVPPQRVTLVNVAHAGLPRLIRFFDEVVLYGGQAVAETQHTLPPHVTVKGPGCSVAVIADDWTPAAIQAAALLVGRSAGRLCTNVRWLLVRDRPHDFADALSAELTRTDDTAAAQWGGGLVLDAAAARRSYAGLQGRLGPADRAVYPPDTEAIMAGARLPPLVAQIAEVEHHALLRAEPLFPLALVASGQTSDLDTTFAHSAFAYAIDRAGVTAALRFDGTDLPLASPK
jgi:Aldehyde dehydrogenase family